MPSDSSRVNGSTNFKVSWKGIEQEMEQLYVSMAVDKYKPKTIIGITRGGLIPAVMLAHAFGVSDVLPVKVQLRDGNSPRSLSISIAQYNRADTLIVDDLWDSGATIKYLRSILGHCTYATLYHKEPEARDIVNYPGSAVSQDQWLQFPWEQR